MLYLGYNSPLLRLEKLHHLRLVVWTFPRTLAVKAVVCVMLLTVRRHDYAYVATAWRNEFFHPLFCGRLHYCLWCNILQKGLHANGESHHRHRRLARARLLSPRPSPQVHRSQRTKNHLAITSTVIIKVEFLIRSSTFIFTIESRRLRIYFR